jgi:hypothetical protein
MFSNQDFVKIMIYGKTIFKSGFARFDIRFVTELIDYMRGVHTQDLATQGNLWGC